MSSPLSTHAVELLIGEAWDAYSEGRYARARSAAEPAVQAAQQLDDPALLVRTLSISADAARMSGDDAAALAGYTRILALAEDPITGHRLGTTLAQWAVANAYKDWVGSAMFLPEMPLEKLFGVLDAAERWLTTIGHLDWRNGILGMRAVLHRRLGNAAAALAAAEEALVAYRADSPGPTLATHRWRLGETLRGVGRHRDALPHYQAVLDDPASTEHGRKIASEGLARCALAIGDPAAARLHATAAVALSEPMGDDSLCTSLAVLIEVCRASGALDEAWTAAIRHLDSAKRLGGHYRSYFAVRDAVDVALDRGDLDTARHLLDELDTRAAAMDKAAGRTIHSEENGERRERLTELERLP